LALLGGLALLQSFSRDKAGISQFADRRSKGPINRLPLSQTDLDDFSFDPMQGAVAAK
jgi:hypothetical protein